MMSNISESSPATKYEEIKLPEAALSSGVVAIISVICVILAAGVLIALVHFRHQLQSKWLAWRRQYWRHTDHVGKAKREVDGEPEMLREDSVVIHDVGFPEEAYFKQDRAPDHRPQPSPSMFRDGAFFDELMSSYEEICCSPTKRSSPQDTVVHIEHVQEILDDVVNKITDPWEMVDLGHDNQPPLRRNSSYQEALAQGINFSLNSIDESQTFSPNNPFALESCTSDDLNPFSNKFHIKSQPDVSLNCENKSMEYDNVSSGLDSFNNQEKIEDDHNVCLEIDEAMLQVPVTKQTFPSNCKWQSTPILGFEDDHEDDRVDKGSPMGASDDEADNSLFNVLKVSRSYSPVYKMSFNSSFGNMTRHNYSSFENEKE